MEACIEVQGEEVCQYPNTLPDSQFMIEIKDPCTEGNIVSATWDYELKAHQLESDTADLSVDIPFSGGVWPWYSNVEMNMQKPGICGPIEYDITYENGDPQELVRFADKDTLLFEPLLEDEIVCHKMALTARFKDYPKITRTEYFTAEVLPCVPNIVVDEAQSILDSRDVNIVWGFDVRTEDLSFLMGSLKQVPNCQYRLSSTPKLWYTDRFPDPNFLALPQYEVREDNMIFDLQKCDSAVDDDDPECSTPPIDYNMKIMLHIKAHDAMDYIVSDNDSLYFDVQVKSPCPQDEVAFDTPIENFVYFVLPNGEPMFKDPMVV